MERLSDLTIWNGRSIGDLLTLEVLASLLGDVVAAILLLCLGWFIAGWLSRRVRELSRGRVRLDETLFNFLGNIVWWVVMALTLLMVLNTFGVQTTSFIAAIGAAGLAVGLALQGTLSNVAAGVMIILFRPIKVGDFVVVNGEMGSVKDISLHFTELANLQNLQVFVPNSLVWGNTITNFSCYAQRRIEWTFSVSYGSDLKKAEEVILSTIMADPRALPDPEPFIQVTSLGAYSVDFLVRVWCGNDDAWGFQTDSVRRVKEALDAAGIVIPFPTQTLVGTGRREAVQLAPVEGQQAEPGSAQQG